MGLSAAKLEIKLTKLVEEKKTEIRDIKQLNQMIDQALINNLTMGFFELSVPEVLDLLVFISSKITKNELDKAYKDASFFLKSVFRMPALNEPEKKMLKELKDFLMFLSVTTSLGLAEQSEALISVKGFVFQTVNSSMSFEKQTQFLMNQIETIRKNMEKIDDVANQLEPLMDLPVVCNDRYDADCNKSQPEADKLFEQMVNMTQLVVENIEDPKIAEESELILKRIINGKITILTLEQRDVIRSMHGSISGDVLIYVSQISLLESKLLDIDGDGITFDDTTNRFNKIEENDFEQRKLNLSTQLRNLFQINDAMDKVVNCIEKIEVFKQPAEPSSNDYLKDMIDDVQALASKARPPVKLIQTISADIVRECSDSDNLEMSTADLQSLKFIKNPLVTFEQMFTSQISVVSQQLASITGQTVTAANLKVDLISASGGLEVAPEVDVSNGTKVGSQEFYIQRYQLMKSSLYTLDRVMKKITHVLGITEDGKDEGTILPNEFALLVVHYVSHSLSSGVITEGMMTAAKEILQATVTVAPSTLEKIILNKALSTITSLKMTILTEIINSKIQLITVLEKNGQHISDLKFTIQTLDSSGNIVKLEETEFQPTTNVIEIQSEISRMSDTTQVILSKVQNFLNETIFKAGTGMLDISQEKFMSEVTSFTLQMGKDFKNGTLLDLGSKLLTYRLSDLSGAAITKLKYIIFTIQNYRILISEEIVDLRSMIGEQLYSKYQGCTTPSAPATTTTASTIDSAIIGRKNEVVGW